MTDEEADTFLSILASEGFVSPFAAHVRDYFPDGPIPNGPERDAALAALKTADEEAARQNRAALRSALRRSVEGQARSCAQDDR